MDDHLNNLYQADFYRWLHQRIRKALKKMPGLRASLDASIAEAYEDAVGFAAFETGLPKSSFPAAPPYATTQILDEDFFP
jgi:hypothetical protein